LLLLLTFLKFILVSWIVLRAQTKPIPIIFPIKDRNENHNIRNQKSFDHEAVCRNRVKRKCFASYSKFLNLRWHCGWHHMHIFGAQIASPPKTLIPPGKTPIYGAQVVIRNTYSACPFPRNSCGHTSALGTRKTTNNVCRWRTLQCVFTHISSFPVAYLFSTLMENICRRMSSRNRHLAKVFLWPWIWIASIWMNAITLRRRLIALNCF